MKKAFFRFSLVALLALFLPLRFFAQDELSDMVKEELDSYYKELVKLDKQIETAEDAERLENRYKNHIKLVESCYGDYSEIIRYDKKLFAIYEDYTDLYQQIGKRIESLKEEQANLERTEKLTVKLNRYLERLDELEAEGNRYVANKRIDSLRIVKKLAEDCYVEEATVEYGANRDFIEENEDLAKLWRKVKDCYSRISIMEVIKSPIDLTLILEIVGIVAAVVLIVTMISSKIKAAQAMKPKKEKKPKKEEEDIPSI